MLTLGQFWQGTTPGNPFKVLYVPDGPFLTTLNVPSGPYWQFWHILLSHFFFCSWPKNSSLDMNVDHDKYILFYSKRKYHKIWNLPPKKNSWNTSIMGKIHEIHLSTVWKNTTSFTNWSQGEEKNVKFAKA